VKHILGFILLLHQSRRNMVMRITTIQQASIIHEVTGWMDRNTHYSTVQKVTTRKYT